MYLLFNDSSDNAQIWLYIFLSALATGIGSAILYIDDLLHFFGVPSRFSLIKSKTFLACSFSCAAAIMLYTSIFALHEESLTHFKNVKNYAFIHDYARPITLGFIILGAWGNNALSALLAFFVFKNRGADVTFCAHGHIHNFENENTTQHNHEHHNHEYRNHEHRNHEHRNHEYLNHFCNSNKADIHHEISVNKNEHSHSHSHSQGHIHGTHRHFYLVESTANSVKKLVRQRHYSQTGSVEEPKERLVSNDDNMLNSSSYGSFSLAGKANANTSSLSATEPLLNQTLLSISDNTKPILFKADLNSDSLLDSVNLPGINSASGAGLNVGCSCVYLPDDQLNHKNGHKPSPLEDAHLGTDDCNSNVGSLSRIAEGDLKIRSSTLNNISRSDRNNVDGKKIKGDLNCFLLQNVGHCQDETCATILNEDTINADDQEDKAEDTGGNDQLFFSALLPDLSGVNDNNVATGKKNVCYVGNSNSSSSSSILSYPKRQVPLSSYSSLEEDQSFYINPQNSESLNNITHKTNNIETNEAIGANNQHGSHQKDYHTENGKNKIPKSTNSTDDVEVVVYEHSENADHLHFRGHVYEQVTENSQISASRKREETMFINGIKTAAAISIHKFPEGLITFISWKSSVKVGAWVSVSLFFHNFPEGMMLALPLYLGTKSQLKTFIIACLLGMIPPILGAYVGSVIYDFLPKNIVINISDPEFGDLMNTILGSIFGFTAGMMITVSITGMLPTARFYDPKGWIVFWSFVAVILLSASSGMIFF